MRTSRWDEETLTWSVSESGPILELTAIESYLHVAHGTLALETESEGYTYWLFGTSAESRIVTSWLRKFEQVERVDM